MSEVIIFIQNHIEYAPYLIFGLLILAGFNIPIPEDGMMFISAILAAKNPDYLPSLFLSVYMGAYLSDLICYGLGRIVGPKLLQFKLFAGIATPERIAKIHNYYEQYGVITLILGRFIPFGVRNGLFLTAGFGQMNAVKFALADLLACTISSVTYFTLYYQFGEAVIDVVKNANAAIFVAAVAIVGYLYFRKRNTRSS